MFRYSLRTMLFVFSLVGVALFVSSQWRSHEKRAETSNRSSKVPHLTEEAVIEFFESRGFQRSSSIPTSQFGSNLIPPAEIEAVCMRADICGFGQVHVFFWLDEPRIVKGKKKGCGHGIHVYSDAPWYMASRCKERHQELAEAYREFALARDYATMISQSSEETRLCLLEGYFRDKESISRNSANLEVRSRLLKVPLD